MITVRTLLTIAVNKDYEWCQLDVKSAFLNGVLDSPEYMLAPEGLEVEKGSFCKLRKTLYGLKEAPKCWYTKLNSFLTEIGFERYKADPCIFLNKCTYILVYVNDMNLLSESKTYLEEVKQKLLSKFDMNDLPDLVMEWTF